MKTRRLGSFTCSEIGMGCMNVSHAYGTPPDEAEAARLLNATLDEGYTLLDTAALYGFGTNETLLGKSVMHRRHEFVLASKCGIFKNEAGVREIDGSPKTIRKTCEDSLRRLNTEVIDLYYLHRWDKRVPIEESVGTLGDLVKEGKLRSIGLSEVSADTLRKAHREYPITAVQSEYSLWTRNPEIAVLVACRELGVTFVAFSPLGRGFLTGITGDANSLEANDIRRSMPRFEQPNYAQNLALLDDLKSIAAQQHCSLAQLALAWILAKDPSLIALPGTTSLAHMRENAQASDLVLDQTTLAQIDQVLKQHKIVGGRYNAATQLEIDTEEFA